jgi:hypothetical protein
MVSTEMTSSIESSIFRLPHLVDAVLPSVPVWQRGVHGPAPAALPPGVRPCPLSRRAGRVRPRRARLVSPPRPARRRPSGSSNTSFTAGVTGLHTATPHPGDRGWHRAAARRGHRRPRLRHRCGSGGMTAVDEPPPVRNDARPDVASILAGAVDCMKATRTSTKRRERSRCGKCPLLGKTSRRLPGMASCAARPWATGFIWEMSVKTCRGEESPCAGIPPSGPKGGTK